MEVEKSYNNQVELGYNKNMEQEMARELELRNDRIVDIVSEKIAEECPNSIDLFAVGGSFASGDFYKKSDLDLVLISNNNEAKCLDKCFILKDVGFDIYTHDFKSFEEMALYPNPFVTKLIDLKMIKTSEYGSEHYKELQEQLAESMNNDEQIEKNIAKHYQSMARALETMQGSDDMGTLYRGLAGVLKYAEYIVYMRNKAYVKGGVKKIPSELASMENLPEGFIDIHEKILNVSNVKELIEKSTELAKTIQDFLGYEVQVEPIAEKAQPQKKEIGPENLVGTYEEIYSNWYNKMIHANETGNQYLSFMTMASCQEFYDEMADEFEISRVELIGKYNPNDLSENTRSFELAMAEWRKNYDKFGIKVNYFDNLDEFEKAYKAN